MPFWRARRCWRESVWIFARVELYRNDAAKCTYMYIQARTDLPNPLRVAVLPSISPAYTYWMSSPSRDSTSQPLANVSSPLDATSRRALELFPPIRRYAMTHLVGGSSAPAAARAAEFHEYPLHRQHRRRVALRARSVEGWGGALRLEIHPHPHPRRPRGVACVCVGGRGCANELLARCLVSKIGLRRCVILRCSSPCDAPAIDMRVLFGYWE
ncbi:hypothetical protein C8R45DRAFT_1222005 [Mycena sanguinolenta]|nr:hypothetical protein C8R45DRAFT_1222005 [Mycena sanguinolenta]